jgi:RNA polymerase sigma-70 factor, ECF subfamily
MSHIERVQGVDTQSAGHEALRRDLVRAVRRVCPKSLAEEAEDLVQDALVRLFKASKLDRQSALSAAYLKKVAYCAVIDEMRRRRRRPAVDPVSDPVEIEDAADGSRAMGCDAALGDALQVCLQRLVPDRRRAVTLHLLGHSGAEVAQILGCNLKRAENLTLRGLAQLREYLHGLGVSP